MSDDPLLHRCEVVIGDLAPVRVEIVDHDPAWSQRFATHARRIRDALGATARRIEHIGSTAVPGLAAKPIIDILLVVDDGVPSDDLGAGSRRERRVTWLVLTAMSERCGRPFR
jgi:GrpB-like predicted nucleotidyltransferase (UPF0157 family)